MSLFQPRTLYLSDLDGTLLNSASHLSPTTVAILDDLTARGLLFSYATARSYVTVTRLTAPLTARCPIITYNGTFAVEGGTGRRLFGHFFDKSYATSILDTLLAHGIPPTVFADVGGAERMSYCPALLSEGMRAFRARQPIDPRIRESDEISALYDGDIFYFSCIDDPEKLLPVYRAYESDPRCRCLYYTDPAWGVQWLEIAPAMATKAQAAQRLKELLGCDRLVCFGDGINDLPLFEAADEAYAVANAHPAVKSAATAVIGTNDEDGVARWLETHATLG